MTFYVCFLLAPTSVPAVQQSVPTIPAAKPSTPASASYGGSYGGSGSYGGQSNNTRPVQRMSDGDSAGNIMPISALNPYSNRWTIKARITNKSDIRTWENARGSGIMLICLHHLV
jgi:ssDNA-binding replication factor A large subunit